MVEDQKNENNRRTEDLVESIEIPDKINEMLTHSFIRSCLFKKEKEELSQYYFALKPKANEAEDRWSSLLSTLEMVNSFENCNNTSSMKKLSENDNVILVSKFNSS